MRTILLLLLGMSLWWACENSPEDLAAMQQRMDTQVERATDVEILYSDSAQIQVRITGDVMLNYLDPTNQRQEFTEGAYVEFFGPTGRVTSTLSAQYAMRYERDQRVLARDSVVWSSIDGQMLETEELIWDEKRQEIYTQKFARITTPREIIYGHGFRANQDFSDARILQIEGITTIDVPE
ncbi:MAG: LPS export ABC transporter periplasmic protein LptC [Lewinella sp.]|nr:LPS export ABC transporter periplasmic protein LptC [Lewinella sp.]